MTLSWKIFFIMLNINYLIIKQFLALYLVGIYYLYIFIYVCYMCIMNMHVNGCIYVFSCFPCYLVLTMTASLCLSTIIRFNEVVWLYLKSLPVWGYCIITRLRYRTVSWLGFADLYMYVYMYWREKFLHYFTVSWLGFAYWYMYVYMYWW